MYVYQKLIQIYNAKNNTSDCKMYASKHAVQYCEEVNLLCINEKQDTSASTGGKYSTRWDKTVKAYVMDILSSCGWPLTH